jgi:hypothetical protein
MMNSEMRSAVIKHHHAKHEIEGMDDELPITIFIISRVKCRQMYSHLHYVREYLKSKDESDNQNQIVTNIMVGVEYICKEWVLDEIRKKKSPEVSRSKSKSPDPGRVELSQVLHPEDS